MKVLLAQKLREFRKKQGLTQEQLAEAMGVTVGAVSKWESGASTPDVSLILELADFFETSVDVLLGYTQQSASLEGSVCRLRDLRIQKDYAAAFREAEKALQRFPNNFQVVYECARIYQLSGLENRDTAALARSARSCTAAAWSSSPKTRTGKSARCPSTSPSPTPCTSRGIRRAPSSC